MLLSVKSPNKIRIAKNLKYVGEPDMNVRKKCKLNSMQRNIFAALKFQYEQRTCFTIYRT